MPAQLIAHVIRDIVGNNFTELLLLQ